jgi:hypothetical protein
MRPAAAGSERLLAQASSLPLTPYVVVGFCTTGAFAHMATSLFV